LNPSTLFHALLLALLLLGAGPAAGQATNPAADEAQSSAPAETVEGEGTGDLVDNLQRSLAIIESGLARGQLTREEIDGIRQQIDFIADSALRVRTKAMRRVEEQTRLLNALGEKPKESEVPESQQVEAERRQLEDSIAEARGRVKSANVILARVDTLRNRLAAEKFGVLARVLGQRTETPLAPGLIAGAFAEMPNQWQRFEDQLDAWWKNVEFNRKRFGTLMWWLVLLVVVVAVVVPTRNWVLRRYGPDHRDESPSFTRRFRVMMAVGLSKVVLPVVSVAGLYVVLLKSAALTAEVDHMAWLLMITLCQYFLVTGLSAAALSPEHPSWRISHFTNDSAIGLYRAIRGFAVIVVVLNLVSIPLLEPLDSRDLNELLAVNVMRDALHALFGAVVAVVIALAAINILRPRNWRFTRVDDEGERTTAAPGRMALVFFTVAKAGLAVSALAALIGYVNLGLFLSQRIVWSLLLVGFALLLRAFIAATCSQAAGEESDVGSLLRDKLGYSTTGTARLMFWVMLLVDIVLSLAVIVFVLLIWGVQATDIGNTAAKLLYGVSIGDYTLSLVDVGIALGIFVVLFFAVRLFQGFLSRRVLAQTVPDVGVRDALTTGVGYAGIIIAAFIAISSLGLELSQLAIIFGALSVGIGFGLQHVVNNFVSGLILLMHRPIKAGDWIVVGQHEGYVKKINVVATEIQTFDNAEVIVPNSQLVSSEVLNWTHKSTVARVIVSVGVSYDADPNRVREVLLRCADQHDDILRMPAPTVVFRDFGESALVFELRFFIRQADYMLLIGSEIRFAISEAFRDAGITIPYPQRDIHIKTPRGEPLPGAGGDAAPTQATERRRDEAGDAETGELD